MLSINSTCAESEHLTGLGLGIPYGGFGANYEYQKSDVLSPFLGAGLTPDGLGWALGCRIHYPGKSSRLRGRVSALYGTTTLQTTYEQRGLHVSTHEELKEGWASGLGGEWRFGERWSVDLDLLYLWYDIPEGYESDGSDVKFSLGFRKRI